ncbi:MAG: hypothetical protein DMG72_23660 [Acidobacteria bacterium]|nr:MAG: hypothetical protein DMG72_23660 [Acidobacteriota bacterium]
MDGHELGDWLKAEAEVMETSTKWQERRN